MKFVVACDKLKHHEIVKSQSFFFLFLWWKLAFSVLWAKKKIVFNGKTTSHSVEYTYCSTETYNYLALTSFVTVCMQVELT